MPLDLDERQEFVNNCGKLAEATEIMYMEMRRRRIPEEVVGTLIHAWFTANLQAAFMPDLPDFSKIFGKIDDDEESS